MTKQQEDVLLLEEELSIGFFLLSVVGLVKSNPKSKILFNDYTDRFQFHWVESMSFRNNRKFLFIGFTIDRFLFTNERNIYILAKKNWKKIFKASAHYTCAGVISNVKIEICTDGAKDLILAALKK